jgi:hypothetical protein
MNMKEIIRWHRPFIDDIINATRTNVHGETLPDPPPTYTDEERKEWIQNHKGLYTWAKALGARMKNFKEWIIFREWVDGKQVYWDKNTKKLVRFLKEIPGWKGKEGRDYVRVKVKPIAYDPETKTLTHIIDPSYTAIWKNLEPRPIEIEIENYP